MLHYILIMKKFHKEHPEHAKTLINEKSIFITLIPSYIFLGKFEISKVLIKLLHSSCCEWKFSTIFPRMVRSNSVRTKYCGTKYSNLRFTVNLNIPIYLEKLSRNYIRLKSHDCWLILKLIVFSKILNKFWNFRSNSMWYNVWQLSCIIIFLFILTNNKWVITPNTRSRK